MKLPQAELLLDPQVRELRDRRPLPVDLLRRRGLHLRAKPRHRSRLFDPRQLPPAPYLRTAARPVGTPRARLRLGPIAMHSHPAVHSAAHVCKRFARRTNIHVALALIREPLPRKLRIAAAPLALPAFPRAGFAQRPDEVRFSF